MSSQWETLDVEALLNRQNEQTTAGGAGGGGGTTSANAGAYQVPLGQPLRRKIPVASPQYKAIDDHKHEQVESPTGNDPEFEWAKSMVK